MDSLKLKRKILYLLHIYILDISIFSLLNNLLKIGLLTGLLIYPNSYFMMFAFGDIDYWMSEPLAGVSRLEQLLLYLLVFYLVFSYAVIFYRIAYDESCKNN